MRFCSGVLFASVVVLSLTGCERLLPYRLAGFAQYQTDGEAERLVDMRRVDAIANVSGARH